MMLDSERALLARLLPTTGVIVDVTADPGGSGLPAMAPGLKVLRPGPNEGLGAWCAAEGVRRIPLLNLCRTGNETTRLREVVEWLRRRRIDIVRLELGPSFHGSGESLFDLAAFLVPFGYTLYKVSPARLDPLPRVMPEDEAFESSIFVALARRFSALMDASTTAKALIDLPEQFARYGIKPRGVIHVGAHEGEELELYKRMGFRRILLVEANPELAQRLRARVAGDGSVLVAHCAVSDADGTVTLRIASDDQTSSILPSKLVRQYYPQISDARQVSVPSRRLDTLLTELVLSPTDFNFLHLDIQGAEMAALRGAGAVLQQLDALTTEVNFEELYEGCGLFDDLDDFLEARQFTEKETACPFHASWGDALYVRRRPAAPANSNRGSLRASSLGRNGRFANQLFQYTFLHVLAQRHGLTVQTPPWVGQILFGRDDRWEPVSVPQIWEGTDFPMSVLPSALLESIPPQADLWGFFQFDTIHYAPCKDLIRSLFQPVPEIAMPLRAALQRLAGPDRTLVGLHVRRGDFGDRPPFFATPIAWCHELLRKIWPTLRNPLLYVASDEPDKVLDELRAYAPVTAADLDVTIQQAPFYADFWVLTQAEVLAIANSSFSFFASMLNERSREFYRPHLQLKHFIKYDPWSAPPLLHRDGKLPGVGPCVQFRGREPGGYVVTFHGPKG